MEISTKELMYAASVLGADHFWGIGDPFEGRNPQDIHREWQALPKSLSDKGYAKIGFEDSVRLTEECSKLVGICKDCEQILGLEINQSSKEPEYLLCYRKGDSLCLMHCQGTNAKLEEVSAEALSARFEEALSWEQREDVLSVESTVPVKLIEEARAKENAIQAVELLVQKGVAKELADIIGETIIGRVKTLRIYLHDIEARTRDAKLILWTEKGTFEVEEILDSYEEIWILRTISKADVLQFIEEKKVILLSKGEGQS